METDVVIPNQHNQFCVSGVSEHPVEAAHVVLPVLQRHREKNTNTQLKQRRLLIRHKLP